MAKLDWDKKPERDPGSVRREEVEKMVEAYALSDRELAAFRRKIQSKDQRQPKLKPKPVGPRVPIAEALPKKHSRKQDDIGWRISIIRRSTASRATDAFIHQTALLVLHHAAEHGDCTAALNLVQAAATPSRKQALDDWFRRCTPIRLSPAKGKANMKGLGAKNGERWDFAGASKRPFFAALRG